MTPWLDDDTLAPELRELLAAGRGTRPLEGAALARSRRRVTALSVVPVAAAGVLFWLQPFAWGAALGSVATLGVAVASGRFAHHEEPVRPAAMPAPKPRPAAPTGPLPREPEMALPAPVLSPSAAPEPSRGRVLAREPSHEPASVDDEAALLEQARRAIAKDPALALAIVGEHARRFPVGALRVEGEVLAIDALVHAGRHAEAEARARALRLRVPGSLYEERLQRILDRR